MPAEHVVAMVGLAWLCLCGLWMELTIRRGRELARRLAERLPAAYAALGEPRPGWWDHPRRHAWFRMIFQRSYAELADPVLVDEFEQVRRDERRQIAVLLVGFAGLGAACVWLEWLGGRG